MILFLNKVVLRLTGTFLISTLYAITMGNAQVMTLMLPANNSTINETNVYFSWLPVSSSGNTVRYEFKLVEILNGQNAVSAIAYNTPLIEQQLSGTAYFSFASLEVGKEYAWSVQAYYTRLNTEGETPYTERINLTTAGVSRFEIPLSVEEEGPSPAYILLKKEVSEPFVFYIPYEQDSLYFRYTEQYVLDSVQVGLYRYGEQGDTLRRWSLLPEPYFISGIRSGDNYISLPKDAFQVAYEEDKIYFLEVKSLNGDIYRAKIEFEN